MRFVIGFVMVALFAVGCASAGPREATPRTNQKLLTAEQIAAVPSSNLFEVVRRLRPEWLNTRGNTSLMDETLVSASVYMNGNNMGRVEFLREINTIDVAEVRYFTSAESIARFGMGHQRGVIEVIRR